MGPSLDQTHQTTRRSPKVCLKVCTKLWNPSYSSFHLSDLPRLDQRRVQLKLSFLYQLVNNLAFCPHEPIAFRNMLVNVPSNNPLLLFRSVCRTSSHYHSFHPSTIALWNNLPHSVTSSSSLYSFRDNVNLYLSAL